MKVSLPWLKELVDYNLTPEQLADKLSLLSIGVKQTTDNFIELDLTYNRGDLLSLRGVAREVAAITDSELKFGDQPFPKYDLPKIKVDVEYKKFCPVYCVAKIENLKVEQTPDIWVKKLSDSGLRSVNNIADVTNLIMMEYGQPMHAFDARGVKDESIIVRVAKRGERITTLDGKTRDLDTSDLLIADSLNALGIAGVMGGKDSEVTDSTTTILLEAAIFDPVSIRKTAKRHGLNSEASRRFQHGLTKTNLLAALAAAIKMFESLGGKLTAISLISLVGDMEDKPKTIQLTQEKINSLLGVDIPSQVVESSLSSLGFHLRGVKLNSWEVTVPFWRLDINIEEDLVEEVARMYGYEKIKGIPLPEKDDILALDQTLSNFIYDLKLKLKKIGLTEVETYSFYSTAVLKTLGFTTDNEPLPAASSGVSRKKRDKFFRAFIPAAELRGILAQNKNTLIKVVNPISSETEYLRTDLWPNLLEVVGKNIRKGFSDVAIFEIGKVYLKAKDNKPTENYRLSISLMNNTDNPLAELYQIAQSLSVHLRGVKLNPSTPPKEVASFFHPTRFVNIERNGKQIAGTAEVHLRLLNKLGIEERVAVLEINIEDIV